MERTIFTENDVRAEETAKEDLERQRRLLEDELERRRRALNEAPPEEKNRREWVARQHSSLMEGHHSYLQAVQQGMNQLSVALAAPPMEEEMEEAPPRTADTYTDILLKYIPA